MVEAIFEFLEKFGFAHPVHPALTHIPMGMAMGAVIFRILSLIPKFRRLAKTGYHCVILGLLGIFPTVFAGYLDWQHTFGGIMDEPLIWIKMVLAAALLIIMAVIVFKDDPEQPGFNKMTLMYLIAVLVAIGLGYSGGELQYG